MKVNTDLSSGISFGYIRADALDGHIVELLQFGSQASEPAYEAALEEAEIAAAERGAPFDEDGFNDDWQPDEPVHEGKISVTPPKFDRLPVGLHVKLKDSSADCPSGEGVVVADMTQGAEEYEVEYSDGEEKTHGLFYRTELEPVGKVHYRTSWLGGALHVWIFLSPFTTDKARRASPCVPNAGILDKLDGSVTAYDVPADWRSDFGEQVMGLPAGVSP